MFLIGDDLHWSASDLTAAATCEYALLRTLDVKLGRAAKLNMVADPLMEHIARLGVRHEELLLDELRDAGGVTEFQPPASPLHDFDARGHR